MARYALVENSIVLNIILWDGASKWNPPKNNTVVPVSESEPVEPGWSYDGATFHPPEKSADDN
jgi:hypothetical protein